MPADEWVEPQIVPSPHELRWELLYDWSLEKTKDDDIRAVRGEAIVFVKNLM